MQKFVLIGEDVETREPFAIIQATDNDELN